MSVHTDLAEKYDASFFVTMNRDASRSARTVLELLNTVLRIRSVADFGCGTGVWLEAWQQLGCEDLTGIDGDFIPRENLCIDPQSFVAHDLQQPLDLHRQFDLVQALEVGEHLPATCADSFVDTLTAHGDLILFSAAVPGQMGIQHVNEQPHDYWRKHFARRGFALLDWLRPQLQGQASVARWYRYNLLLFARETKLLDLPPEIRQTQVPTNRPIVNLAPFTYRCRCAITRWLSVTTVDKIVRTLHRRERKRY